LVEVFTYFDWQVGMLSFDRFSQALTSGTLNGLFAGAVNGSKKYGISVTECSGEIVEKLMRATVSMGLEYS
jgi:hypothetical protein